MTTTRQDDSAGSRILLIESHRQLREATQELLVALGHEVVAIPEWSEVEVPSDLADTLDLVIVEAYSPGGRGLEQLDKLRGQLGRMPAILISGYGEDEDLRSRVGSGDVEFLPAPFTAESLSAVIHNALSRPTAPAIQSSDVPPASPPPSPATDRPTDPRPSRLGTWKLAAGLVIVLGVLLLARQTLTGPPPLPDAPELDQLRSSEVIPLRPSGELERAPERFVWQAFPGARSYRVSVFEVTGTRLWQQETGLPSLAIPESLRTRFADPVIFEWAVDALDGSGSTIGASRRTKFRSRAEGTVDSGATS